MTPTPPREASFEEALADTCEVGGDHRGYQGQCASHCEPLRAAHARELAAAQGACPCLHIEPCLPDCTCVKPYSSRGCRRCCSYGSKEQKIAAANHLIGQLAAARAENLDACIALGNYATLGHAVRGTLKDISNLEDDLDKAKASVWRKVKRWAVERWNAEVANRPDVNVHKRTLDSTWRQVEREAEQRAAAAEKEGRGVR